MSRFLLTVSLVLLFLPVPARAVIVFEKGRDEPTVGRLLSKQGPKYTVRVESADGTTQDRVFFEAVVDSIVITVSEQRLRALEPGDPEAYRDYAEELAEKKRDPDARSTAIRLYLIAAHLAPDSLGRSSLLGMVPLARNPLERRRFLAMAYLLDPRHDNSLLLPARQPESEEVGEEREEGERLLLKALREFRQGNTRRARVLLEQDRVKRALSPYTDIISYEELHNAQYDTPPGTLYKMLRLELRLARGGTARENPQQSHAQAWSEIAKRGLGAPIPSLSLKTITEFDPAECVFRDGHWTSPADSDTPAGVRP